MQLEPGEPDRTILEERVSTWPFTPRNGCHLTEPARTRHQEIIRCPVLGEVPVAFAAITASPDARAHYDQRRGRHPRPLIDTGLGWLPFSHYNANRAWVELVLLAAVLLAALQTLVDDPELSVAEPRRLRYTLLHIAARVVRGSRRTHVRLDRTWPWTAILVAVHRRLDAMPVPAVC